LTDGALVIGYAKLALLVGSVCLISFVLMDFRHTSPSEEMKVFQHNTSRLNNSHRGRWRLCGLILCSSSRGFRPPQRSSIISQRDD